MTFDPETRNSLISQLASLENEEAWAEFVLIYQPVIQRFLTKYGLQYADAAEVTQEVLSGVV
jgi:RNA polymerase sigma-70 factor (ECF subfamily)